MAKPRLNLAARMFLALAAMGLLPLGISYFQLATQYDVLVEQVQRSHQLAAGTAAKRVGTEVDRHLSLARSTAEHPATIEGDPASRSLGELLTGHLATGDGLVALGVFDAAGVRVMLAKPRDRDLDTELGGVLGPLPEGREPSVEWLTGADGPLLRLRHPVVDGEGLVGWVVLVTRADTLPEMLEAPELGPSFHMLLAAIDGDAPRALVGGELSAFPTESIDLASSGKLGTGATVYRQGAGAGEEIVVGHAQVTGAPWFVLSRQPAAAAEVARQRMERVTLQATGLALLLTVLLSAGGFFTIVRPLRRLAAAQRELAGEPVVSGGSEIEQLEASFDLLRQRIRDSEDLGQIFLGRYQVTDLVGSGAMGSVFRGWDDKLSRAVALKTVHLDSEDVDREKLLVNLRDEAAITARIHQPNIVTVYDIEDRGSTAFIAMEYVEGTNLQQILRVRKRLPPLEALAIGAGIARGLGAAHSHYLVHHDVKPANILLGLDGSVKLTDFGVSLSISAASQRKDVIC
ncbi:MAG: protein kinase, partial [Acidobacteriota bacterium]